MGEKVLFLYYTLEEPELPVWARSVIYGALGYFLTPWDAAPDFIPGVGYADDLGVLTAALATVAVHVTPYARQRAREQLDRWLGSQ
ncbi:MAG TPA: YkvA family protein [Gammaproteobacteria bacterium]|nr:YkvA family protein [Gammaproteobacteria bacterium]